jgi:hypothetical protein
MAESDFKHIRGAGTCYVGDDGGTAMQYREVLMLHGEDADTVLEEFWKHNSGEDFLVVLKVAHGAPPRPHLSTKASLETALKTARIEAGSSSELKWKAACVEAGAIWPSRLRPKAA